MKANGTDQRQLTNLPDGGVPQILAGRHQVELCQAARTGLLRVLRSHHPPRRIPRPPAHTRRDPGRGRRLVPRRNQARVQQQLHRAVQRSVGHPRDETRRRPHHQPDERVRMQHIPQLVSRRPQAPVRPRRRPVHRVLGHLRDERRRQRPGRTPPTPPESTSSCPIGAPADDQRPGRHDGPTTTRSNPCPPRGSRSPIA